MIEGDEDEGWVEPKVVNSGKCTYYEPYTPIDHPTDLPRKHRVNSRPDGQLFEEVMRPVSVDFIEVIGG